METKKIRTITGKVIDAVLEAPDTWTLHIAVADEDRDYQAGQFISIDPHQFPELSEIVAYFEHIKKRKEVVRAYSLASAPYEPYLSITTKPERFHAGETEFPPLLSPLLASNALLGRSIRFLGYTGAYILAPDHGQFTDEVLHFVAGSGVVPNFALIKDELLQNKNQNVVHTFIDVNKTYNDIIYRTQLDELAKAHPSRLKLMHFLTREENPQRFGPCYFSGRPTLESIHPHVKDPSSTLVFACGAAITKWQRKMAKETGNEPKPRFLETISEIVYSLGIDKKRFKREVYG